MSKNDERKNQEKTPSPIPVVGVAAFAGSQDALQRLHERNRRNGGVRFFVWRGFGHLSVHRHHCGN